MKSSFKLQKWLYFVTFSALLVLISGSVSALEIVVPNASTGVDAGAENAIPYGSSLFCSNGMRYQQVYNDSEIPDGFLVTALRYRQDAPSGDNSFSATLYTSVSVTLSTTTADSTSMSLTFANNVGPDQQLVFSGNLTLSSAASVASPRPFDIEIPFQNPFTYNGGNLLVDTVIQGCATPPEGVTFFDSETNALMPVTRVYIGDWTSATAQYNTVGSGLVTQFQLETATPAIPVPALSIWALILLSILLGLIVFAKRRSLFQQT